MAAADVLWAIISLAEEELEEELEEVEAAVAEVSLSVAPEEDREDKMVLHVVFAQPRQADAMVEANILAAAEAAELLQTEFLEQVPELQEICCIVHQELQWQPAVKSIPYLVLIIVTGEMLIKTASPEHFVYHGMLLIMH